MALTKIIGATIAIGGMATAATLLFLNNGTIEWRPASEDKNASTNYGDGKYAKTYQKYLVGVEDEAIISSKGPKSNKSWWDWSFENIYKYKKAETKGKFSNLQKATGDTGSLQAICKEAYMASKDGDGAKIKETINNETDEFKESDIWLFCSPSETKIKTIKDVGGSAYGENGTSEKYGKKYESQLVSKDNNDWFWNLKQEELKKETSLIENKAFSNLKKKLLNGTNTNEDTVRKICETAYNQTAPANGEGDTSQYPKAEIFKFCSLSGVENSSTG